jgi:hypothetical protein
MQREKATDGFRVVVAAAVEEATLAIPWGEPLPPHPDASSANAAAAAETATMSRGPQHSCLVPSSRVASGFERTF